MTHAVDRAVRQTPEEAAEIAKRNRAGDLNRYRLHHAKTLTGAQESLTQALDAASAGAYLEAAVIVRTVAHALDSLAADIDRTAQTDERERLDRPVWFRP
jgi:hypothetical protein